MTNQCGTEHGYHEECHGMSWGHNDADSPKSATTATVATYSTSTKGSIRRSVTPCLQGGGQPRRERSHQSLAAASSRRNEVSSGHRIITSQPT